MKSFLSCAVMLIGLVACGAQATHAAVINDFTGAFAVGNWTTSATPGDGYVYTSDAPTSILIASSDNGFAADTDFSISMPFDGTVTFDWSFSSFDGAKYESFSVGSGSSFTQLTNNGGASTQTGTTYSVSLGSGEKFTFRAYSSDGAFGRSETTITNFVVSYTPSGAVPEPTSMAIFGLGALGMAYRQRRKNKS